MVLNQKYGQFHDMECQDLKEGLAELDPLSTGRVPLGYFYAKQKIGYWNLLESQAYLRQLGAIDDTVHSRGAQVIIPNYVTAMSNCDGPSRFYSICCIHECTSLLNSLEVSIQAPTANAVQILSLVMNLPSSTVEAPRNLSSALVGALEKIAAFHGGDVPLHGRLFAQWLHFAFPHECPYPFRSGTLNPLSPLDYLRQIGSGPLATLDEKQKHMEAALEVPIGSAVDHLSMWTLEEEMFLSVTGISNQSTVVSWLGSVVQIAMCGVVLG